MQHPYPELISTEMGLKPSQPSLATILWLASLAGAGCSPTPAITFNRTTAERPSAATAWRCHCAADDAILTKLADYVLAPEVVEGAILDAIAELRRSRDDLEPRRAAFGGSATG